MSEQPLESKRENLRVVTVLIIEDNLKTQTEIKKLCVKEGFKVLQATKGKEGLKLAREKMPDAITLGIELPDLNGFEVLNQLKKDELTKNIPVHIISSIPDSYKLLAQGADACMSRPFTKNKLENVMKEMGKTVDKNIRSILIVDGNDIQLNAAMSAVGSDSFSITGAHSYEEAIARLREKHFDAVIVDLYLPDRNGRSILKELRGHTDQNLPIIVYTGRDLTSTDEIELRKYANDIIIKSEKSVEKIIGEASVFLHKVEQELRDRL